jgi:hypothetical protein
MPSPLPFPRHLALLLACLLTWPTFGRAAEATYSYVSEPTGLVSQTGLGTVGDTLTTPVPPAEVSGWSFAYWRYNGVRQAAENGSSLPAVRFVLSGPATLTAVYLRTTEDSDADGQPDWYEWLHFGNLDQTGTGDPDADGLPNAIEAARGYSPRLQDRLDDGGIASRRSGRMLFAAGTDATYVIESSPTGYVAQAGTAAPGTSVTTPTLQGEVSGWVFSYWRVGGVRQAGSDGVATPSVRQTLSGPTTFTAVYLRATEDTDLDGIPDWYEWQQFGNLDQTGAGDPDGDGLSTALEAARGYSPRLKDRLDDGGIASRRSAKLAFVGGTDTTYVIESTPPGYVAQNGVVAVGSSVTTPALQGEVSGWVFSYWRVDGVRQAGPDGVATPSVRRTISGPTILTAVYLRTTEDTDADGIPDWYEWQQFGNLDQTSAGDPDGDGLSNALEAARGYSPRLKDRLDDGGIASRRSAKLIFLEVTNAGPPVIDPPLAAKVARPGESVTWQITATGAQPLSYQWRQGGTPISGATAATYTIASVQAADEGSYDVVVTNSAGTSTSSAATLTVLPPVPVITSAGTANGIVGQAFSYQITATNTPTSFAATGLPTGLSLNGTTGLLSGTPTTAGTTTITLTATNAGGTSNPASLTLTVSAAATAPVITTQPQSQTIAAGLPVTFSVTANGAALLTYQWRKGGTSIPSATAATYTIAAVQSADAGSYDVVVTNPAGSTPSSAATLTVTSGSGGPAASLQLVGPAYYLPAGGTLTFQAAITYAGLTPSALGYVITLPDGFSLVSIGGTNVPNVAPTPGTTGVLEFAYSTLPANAASFSVVVAYPAGLTGNRTVTAGATYRSPLQTLPVAPIALARLDPPVITTPPASGVYRAGSSLTLTVVATSGVTPTYQWRKGDTPLSGATLASLTFPSLALADAGAYTVAVTNAAGDTVSSAAQLHVLEVQATHALSGAGYVAGSTVTITNTLTFSPSLTSLAWEVLPPAGWTYASGAGTEGNTRPAVGTADLLTWSWSSVPSSPVSFSYTLNVPAGTTGEKTLSALVRPGVAAGALQVLAQPEPLRLLAAAHHSADTNRDLRISLLELTRVIELYNTRQGNLRTGAYRVQDGTEDGFASEPAPVPGAALTRHHSADTDRNGRLSLYELTRVIELYHTREAATRTGRYSLRPGSEDGFTPGG